MSFGKVARKLKRVGKSAVQFRFTSTFEYLDVSFNGTWRPDTLRVVWLRNHRKVKSTDVKWVPTEDRGPNGADGRAVFDPIISVALIVTLYRETGKVDFQEKEYKYYLESDGPSGKKILASFNCDMSEYAAIPVAEHTLDMTFKPVSQKVNKAILGITLKSEFIKQGTTVDDDMQSTFSAMSAGTDASYDDESDSEESELNGKASRLSIVEESTEKDKGVGSKFEDSLKSVLVLGTGETLKRNTLPALAPPKPDRYSSFKSIPDQVPYAEESLELTSSQPSKEISSSTQHDQPPPIIARSQKDQPPSNQSLETSPEESSPQPDQSPSTSSPTQYDPPCTSQPDQQSSTGALQSDQPSSSERIDEKQESLASNKPAKVASLVVNGAEKSLEQSSKDKKLEESSKDKRKLEDSSKGKKKLEESSKDKKLEESSKDKKLEESSKDKKLEESSKDKKLEESSKDKKLEESSKDKKLEDSSKDKKLEGSNDHKQKESSIKIDKSKLEESNKTNLPTHENHTEVNGDSSVKADPSDHSQATMSTGSAAANELIESTEPKQKPQSETAGESNGGGYDYVFEAARALAQIRQSNELSPPATSVRQRQSITSQEEYRPPPNPYLQDEEEEVQEDTPEPPSPTAKWLGEEATFVDCFGEGVGREKLDRAEVIAMYFSASWCPPCRRFLPKLVKFYHHMKQHGKSFEVLYISSDYSKQEMMKYMQQQQMPWVGLAFEGKISQKLQKDFNVSAIPQLKVVSTRGKMIEENAKKQVEVASSGSDVLKLYNKWHEKLEPSENGLAESSGSGHKEKSGLLQKVKKAIKGKEEVKLTERPAVSEDQAPESTNRMVSAKSREDLSGTRQVVEGRSRGRSNVSLGGKSRQATLEEKEERIRYLEEVNMTLKQTNDELNEEVADLKRQLSDIQTKMSALEQTSKQLEEDKRETVAKLSTRGWLYKRGVRGPTANVWRRRYFRCDQGSKICYYKSAAEGAPQGFIDLVKVISVQEVSPAQQDKNNATFLVQCDGRTFQLQAHDEATMRKWMSAIEYLGNWHRTHSLKNGATP